jgi:hypothetical protein
MTQSYVLHLVVSPSVEYAVADWLLEREELSGFSSLEIRGHGSSEKSMSLAEQVAGRQRQTLFVVHMDEAAARVVLAALREAFRGSGMHYWLTPAAEAGHIA